MQVYGKEIFGNVKSKSKLKVENDYAKSHYLAENLIKKYNKKYDIEINILRLSYSFSCPVNNKVYRPDLIPINFCLDAINKNEISLKSNGDFRRDFIYLNDVYKKIKVILNKKYNKSIYYNFSSGKTFKIIEVAKMVQHEANKILKKKIKLKINWKNKVKENKFVVISDIYNKDIKKIYIKNKLRYEIKQIIKYYENFTNRL